MFLMHTDPDEYTFRWMMLAQPWTRELIAENRPK